MSDPKLTRTEWRKTPYAGTEAKDADGALTRLLEKYRVRDIATIAFSSGAHGRPGWGVRFVLDGKCYRVSLETLHVYPGQVSEAELKVQVKRAVFHFLKSALEMATVFMPVEQVLFAFLELPGAGGATAYEAALPHLAQLRAPDFGRLMLPPAPPPAAGGEVIDAEVV